MTDQKPTRKKPGPKPGTPYKSKPGPKPGTPANNPAIHESKKLIEERMKNIVPYDVIKANASVYTYEERLEMFDRILHLYSEGMPMSLVVKRVSDEMGKPITVSMWNYWVQDSQKPGSVTHMHHPDISERYNDARRSNIYHMAEEVYTFSDASLVGPPEYVQARKLQIETRKWLLSKLAPQMYGESLKLMGDANNPILPAIQVQFVDTKKDGK